MKGKVMGHKNFNVKIKGVLITDADDNDLAFPLDFILNEPEENWEEAIEEDNLLEAKVILENIKDLPKGDKVSSIYSCQVTASGPMAVGWVENICDVSDRMISDLEKILNEAGFQTAPIEGNKFETYG
jgi:hypothetical protein